jgi:hypothetical protein
MFLLVEYGFTLLDNKYDYVRIKHINYDYILSKTNNEEQ